MRSVRSKEKVKLTSYHKPMLATLSDKPFNDPEWVFEIKWDGYRAIAEIKDGNIQLYSRNGLSFISLYPQIADALKSIKTSCVLDGEVVVFNEANKPDFQQLQQFGDLRKGTLVYYVFDCLAIDGKSITHLPLLERKDKLKNLLPESAVIKFATHVEEDGIEFFNAAREMDLEGIIAKRASARYFPGKRSGDWLKIKNHNIQEAIIAGYTEPRGARTYFGALILAIMNKGKLRYIGHTGTGFKEKTLRDVYKKLQPIKRKTSPFENKVAVNTPVTWIEPELVCNIKFTEITQGGILRHPVFMGLRIDKSANETTHLETPVQTASKDKNIVVKKSKKKQILS